MALAVGVSGVECAAGVGRMYTGSGRGSRLLVACAMGFWGSSPASFPVLPHSTREGFLLFSSMTHRRHLIQGHPVVSEKLLLVLLSIPLEATAVEPVHPKWCQSGTLPLM